MWTKLPFLQRVPKFLRSKKSGLLKRFWTTHVLLLGKSLKATRTASMPTIFHYKAATGHFDSTFYGFDGHLIVIFSHTSSTINPILSRNIFFQNSSSFFFSMSLDFWGRSCIEIWHRTPSIKRIYWKPPWSPKWEISPKFISKQHRTKYDKTIHPTSCWWTKFFRNGIIYSGSFCLL